MKIARIGGTGSLGAGLSAKWARVKEVVISSRSYSSARAKCDRARVMISNPKVKFSLVLLLMIAGLVSAAGKRDPETGRIKVLYIGEPTGSSPYPMFESDPLILPYPVRASTVVFSVEIAKRSIRQYMPRTYDEISSYQVIILSDANAGVFTGNHMRWLQDSVSDRGSGLVMIGGYEAFGAMAGHTSWGGTPVDEILPVESLGGQWTEGGGKVKILKTGHPFVASLPIRPGLDWIKNYEGNKVRLKEGADELARLMAREPSPFWVTWKFDQGRTFAIAGDWTPGGGVVLMRWEYYGDLAINLMLYLSDNELPEDLQTVHQARNKFHEYRSSKAYLLAVMEFGEKFSANMNPVVEIIEEAELTYGDATQAYLDFDYAGSVELVDDSLQTLTRGSEKAFELKDQAMIWIYMIEWMAVTATFSICGFVVWTLMVRKRLYQEIKSTRFVG